MDKENQDSEDFQSINGNSDMILLIALLAFVVIVAVAVLFIIFDTRDLYPPLYVAYGLYVESSSETLFLGSP